MNVITLTWDIERSETPPVFDRLKPFMSDEEQIIVIALQNVTHTSLKNLRTCMRQDFREYKTYVSKIECGQVIRGLMLATIVLSKTEKGISVDCKRRCSSRHMGYMTVVVSHEKDCLFFTNVHLSPSLKHRASKTALLNTLEALNGSQQFQDSMPKCRKSCLMVVLGDFNSYSDYLTKEEIALLSKEEVSHVQTEQSEQSKQSEQTKATKDILCKIRHTDYLTRILSNDPFSTFSKYDYALMKIVNEEQWKEGKIFSRPTFPWGRGVLEVVKYSRGLGGLMPMQKIVRHPAYADRILHKSEKYGCIYYESFEPYNTISHSAVCAIFSRRTT